MDTTVDPIPTSWPMRLLELEQTRGLQNLASSPATRIS